MLTRPAKPMDAARLWAYALGALGRRALSAGEIRQKLLQRAADKADVDRVMAQLAEYGYLDDRRFAEQFAQSRIENQSFGSRRVVRDLRSRRVPTATVEAVVKDAYGDRDETALIEQFIERKFRKLNLREYLADPAHLASAYRKLLVAGFGGTMAIKVLRRYSERAEELEADEPIEGGDGSPE